MDKPFASPSLQYEAEALPPALHGVLTAVRASLHQKVRYGLCECIVAALTHGDVNAPLNNLLTQIKDELTLVGRHIASLASRLEEQY